MIHRAYLPTVLSMLLVVSILSLMPSDLVGTNSAHATSPPTSWNPNVSCAPLVIRISDITANQTGTASQNASPFTPGITTSIPSGDAKRWLTPGPTPSGWFAPGPSCTVTNSKGTTSLFVQINGVRRDTLVNEDFQRVYDPTNGGTNHTSLYGDTTFNLYDPALAPQAPGCSNPNDPSCHGIIHAEIDHDWKAAGYCGTGTVCDNATLASKTTNSTLLDVQGFIYWDNGSSTYGWHQFSGWELHPLTAWRLSSTVNFSWLPTNPQVGQLITFTATSNGTAPASVGWNFGDGVTASGKTVSHIYTTPQAFSVHVTMTDTQGVTVSTTKTVTVGSWNPAEACAPVQTTLENVIGNITVERIPSNPNSNGTDYSGGGFKLDGNLVYGSNPKTWPFARTNLHPPCAVSGTSAFVEFHNVTFTDINVSNCGTKYANGTSYPHGWQSCDTTFNLITPGFGDPSTCPQCYLHKIYGGIDKDWNASGIAPLPRPSDGARIDIQGFVYWNSAFVNASWHSYSGWEIHPLSAWRPAASRITASASFNPSSPIAGQAINFTGTATGGTGPYKFSWDFGDGSGATGTPASHSYPVGTYTVHMSANDSRGNMGVTSRTITVVPPPDFSVSVIPSALNIVARSSKTANVSLSSLFEFTGNVSLASLPPGGVTATLNPKSAILSAGGSSTATLTISPSNAGNYTVQVTGTSGSLSHSANVTVRVTDAPPTVSLTTSSSSVFRDQQVTLSITASDPDGTVTSLKANWGDGTVDSLLGNATSDHHAYIKSGMFTVNVTATDNGGMTASATATITVTDAPPTVSFTASPTITSTGQTVTLSITSNDSDGTITQTVVNWGDGTIHTLTGSATADTHTYANTGNFKSEVFTITVTVTDNATLTGSNTALVTINDVPPVASFTSSVTSASTGVSITFTATRSSDPDGTIANYTWTFGDGGTGNGAVVSHSYAITGNAQILNYTVTLTVTDNSGNTGATQKNETIIDRSPVALFSESATSDPTGVSIIFNATESSDPDGTVVGYSWAFGDGGTGSGPVFSHAYANTGTTKIANYTVTLTVTDNSGNTGTAQVMVTISDRAPVASFTTSASSALTQVSITFNATESSDPDGSITTYSWNFGDGSTASGSVVTHAYANADNSKSLNYNVTLTVTDNSGNTGTAQVSETITDRSPTASFTSSQTSALTGISITYNATSSNDSDGTILSYAWTFGDGSTGIGPVVTHVYANTGTAIIENFTVTLTVTDNGGSTATAQTTDTITDRGPVAGFTVSSQSVLTGVSVTFNATSSSDPDGTISAYSWSFGDGSTASGKVVTHVYANTDNSLSHLFNVTLTITDNSGNTGAASLVETVNDRPPVASFNTSTTSALTGVNITFNATASTDPDGTVASYTWSFGDGSIGTGVLVSHSYSNTGNSLAENFRVTLTVIDNSGNNANTTSQIAITDRVPIASFTESTPSALTGVSISFNATASNDADGTVTGYSWTFGDGTTASGKIVTHAYASTGSGKTVNFPVTLTVTDNGGNTGSVANIETIADRPPVAFFTPSQSSVLTGTSVSFNATASNDPDGTIANYTWTFGDGGTGNGKVVSHTYFSIGNAESLNYTVVLTVIDNGGNSGTLQSTETVIDRQPVAIFTRSASSALTGVSLAFNATASSDPDGTIASYSWSFGDGATATGAFVTHFYASTSNGKTAMFTVTLNVTDNSGNTGIASMNETIMDRPPTATFTSSSTSTLTGVSITFNATSSDDLDGTISSYSWTFGDSGTATGEIVTHTYASTGGANVANFTLTLTVTDNSGSTGTALATETVNDRLPIATFTSSQPFTLTGTSITFNATGSFDPDGTISTYAWTFGDGTTGTGAVVTHTYPNTGNAQAENFTVTLAVTDNSGNIAASQLIEKITDRNPLAIFTTSAKSALTGANITFNATGSIDPDGTLVTYTWAFGDGGVANGTVVSHAYSSTGNSKVENFTVTLTVADNSGNTGSIQSIETISNRPPLASFTESTTSALTGVSITFNATASSDADGTVNAYSWAFGDGATATGLVVTHVYAGTGSLKTATYVVALNITDNSGLTGTAQITETITDRTPTANFTETQTAALTGVGIAFNATGSVDPDGTIATYSWNFGDGSTGIGPVVTHAYVNTGNSSSMNYTVTLTVTDNSGNTGTAQFVEIITDRNPTATFLESTSSAQTLIGISFNATASNDPDGTVTSYFWSFGDGATASGAFVTHTYANTGNAKAENYTVTLTVTDNSGNTATSQVTEMILDRAPTASFTLSTTSVYTGVTISFNATTSNDPDGNITGYSWNFGDGNGGSGLVASHAYTTPGNYSVTLTVTDNGGNIANATFVENILNRPPVAIFTPSSTQTLTLTSISFNATASFDPDGTIVGYAWNFGDGATGSGITITHSYSKAGNYTVMLAVTDNGGLVSTQNLNETIMDRPPTAAFTYTPGTPLENQMISFDASASSDPDGTIASFSWSFGDGSTGTGVAPQHSYALNGTYTVFLNLTDNSGSVASSSVVMAVGFDPTPTWPGGYLDVIDFGSRSVSLSWSPAFDNVQVSSYNLYVNGTLLASLRGSVTSYTATGLNPLSHYLFQIQAGNPSNRYSTSGPSTLAFTHLLGDINLDCKVNIVDLTLVAISFGSRIGDPSYNSKADINGDGVINVSDLVLVGSNFGAVC